MPVRVKKTRQNKDLEYPLCAMGIFGPDPIISQQGVGEDDQSAHDGGDGDLCGLSGFEELGIEGLHTRIEPACDEGRHIEGLAEEGSAAADEGVAFPCAGLSLNGGEAGEA